MGAEWTCALDQPRTLQSTCQAGRPDGLSGSAFGEDVSQADDHGARARAGEGGVDELAADERQIAIRQHERNLAELAALRLVHGHGPAEIEAAAQGVDRERDELDAGFAAAVGALALDDAAEDDAVVLLAVVVDDAGDDALVAVPEAAGVVVLGLDDGFAGEELGGAVDACLGEDAGVAAGAEGVAAEQACAGDGE